MRGHSFGLKPARPRLAVEQTFYHDHGFFMKTLSVLFAAAIWPALVFGADPMNNLSAATNHPLQFIDTSFENASPVWYELAEDGTVQVHLLYDHERSSPNRAAGHFHFRVHAPAGSKLTLEFRNLDNVWNGQHGSISRELKAAVISENGRDWTSIPLETFETNRTRVTLTMPGEALYMARVEPYRLSDLERMLEVVRNAPQVKVSVI